MASLFVRRWNTVHDLFRVIKLESVQLNISSTLWRKMTQIKKNYSFVGNMWLSIKRQYVCITEFVISFCYFIIVCSLWYLKKKQLQNICEPNLKKTIMAENSLNHELFYFICCTWQTFRKLFNWTIFQGGVHCPYAACFARNQPICWGELVGLFRKKKKIH